MEVLHFVLLAVICVAVDSAPDGYIVKVSKDCGYGKSDGELVYAMVTVKTDLPRRSLTAKGECLENIKSFNKIDDNTYQLPVFYDLIDGSDNCTFKNISRYLFRINVLVAYGEPGQPIHQYEDPFIVTCGADYGTGNVPDLAVEEGFLAPDEMASYNGIYTENVTMIVTDILDEPFGSKIGIGQFIKLKASISGSGEGILATSCAAVGDNGLSHKFLRGGCGDGLILKRDQGFVTSFQEATSPPFEFFGIAGADTVSFFCNFSICSTHCAENSCVNHISNMKKRSVDAELSTNWVVAHTSAIGWTGSLENDKYPVAISDPVPLTKVVDRSKEKVKIALLHPYNFLQAKPQSIEAMSPVISVVYPESADEKSRDNGKYVQTKDIEFLKVILVLIASLSLLSVTMSMCLALKRKNLIYQTNDA